ncbi:hypothetical protein GCM10009601_17690 [Streptomyces thermospinosisporus]|uniref:Uncharacterized protein n=1 Tax=Streptomyces thermospinosisporus TaxID=161482 RepID=A0ABP4JHX7_9ACTN
MSLARARDAFGPVAALAQLRSELAGAIGGDHADAAAAYLVEELTGGPEGFVVSAGGLTLLEKFRRTVGGPAYEENLAVLDDLAVRRQLVEAWLTTWAASTGTDAGAGDLAEAVAVELCPGLPRYTSEAQAARWAEVKSAYGGNRDGTREAGRVA